jgi:hypothetical protein
VIVVEHVERVAAHLARHPPARLGFVQTGGDVDVLVVVEDPGFGLLGGGRPFVGLLLHEVAERRDGRIDLFAERAVQREVAGETHGPDRRLARHHDGGLLRRAGRGGPGLDRRQRGLNGELRPHR